MLDAMEIRHYLQIAATVVGFATAILVYYLGHRKSLALQRLENYVRLELESNRLFAIARENQEMIGFLEGWYKPRSKKEEAALTHQLTWFSCEVLNLFELAITFRRKGILEREAFITWIAWFHEFSASERFPLVWTELRLHYKPLLRQLMDDGVRSAAMASGEDDGCRWYFRAVSRTLSAPEILDYFDRCMREPASKQA